MDRADWAKSFFDETFLTAEALELNNRVTSAECDMAVRLALIVAGQRVLDLGCGHGRHSIELARRGYGPLHGLDISAEAIEHARRHANGLEDLVEFAQGDMHALEFCAAFDVVLSFYSSMFYWDDDANLAILKGVHRALTPGGLFMVDFYNRDAKLAELAIEQHRLAGPLRRCKAVLDQLRARALHMLRREPAPFTHRTKDRTFDVEAGVLRITKHFHIDGRPPVTREMSVRLYTVAELKALLSLAGFETIVIADSATGDAVRHLGPRITMVTRRQ